VSHKTLDEIRQEHLRNYEALQEKRYLAGKALKEKGNIILNYRGKDVEFILDEEISVFVKPDDFLTCNYVSYNCNIGSFLFSLTYREDNIVSNDLYWRIELFNDQYDIDDILSRNFFATAQEALDAKIKDIDELKELIAYL
jgi:hypothetical protein